jgi:mRNA-degrading endonuclease RelE of RelBE toxin-antitoxin system
MLTTITELPEYIRRADDLFSESERKAVIDYLAEHPRAGDVMEGTSGIRKLRWGRGNKGKSGGVRVIYYYHDERIPLYLLTVFGKNERANLSKADRNSLAGLVSILVATALEKINDEGL